MQPINRKILRNLKAETEKKKLQERIEVVTQLILQEVVNFAKVSNKHSCDVIITSYVEELRSNAQHVIDNLKTMICDVSMTLRTYEFNLVYSNNAIGFYKEFDKVYSDNPIDFYKEIGEVNVLEVYSDNYGKRYTLTFDW
jgi:secreted trypsin-like serine protease